MTDPQLEINFVHKRENNSESQAHLKKNKQLFNKKCKTVLDWLLEGKQLKVLDCANDGVASLPRRILDIRSKNVGISDKWENGVKVYYMTPEQINDYNNSKK